MLKFFQSYTVFLLPALLLTALGVMLMRYRRATAQLHASPHNTPLLPFHRCTRRDALYAVLITAAYAVFALAGLGDNAAPQTFHRFTIEQPSLTITLDGEYQISKIRYYTGSFHQRDKDVPTYTVSALQDGAYTSIGTMPQTHGSLFHWLEFTPELPSPAAPVPTPDKDRGTTPDKDRGTTPDKDRGTTPDKDRVTTPDDAPITTSSLRLKSKDLPMELGELALYDEHDNLISSARITVDGAAALFDEQHIVPDEISYMNSMYFDEIYHARTAREFLLSDDPYETTHPPLGKVIISIGIALFGMTPFGWRLPGVIFGILMLPFFYVLVKNMFGKSWLAACSTLIFAADFMHYTQTRIATIDTYAVFFIILMYLFMYRHIARGYAAKPFKHLLPLALSGISFGLGAASKWTCIYAGAGLLVLYLYGAVTDFAQHRRRQSVGEPSRYLPRLFASLAAAAVFFIVIPALIYYCSYYYFARGLGEALSLGVVWDNQMLMYNYHAFLEATHPYQSAWYQWIVNGRPILYYMTYGDGTRTGFAALLNPIVSWGGLMAVIAMTAAPYRTASRARRAFAIALCVLAVLCTLFLILIDQSTAYEEPVAALSAFAALPSSIMTATAATFIVCVVTIYALPRIGAVQRSTSPHHDGGACAAVVDGAAAPQLGQSPNCASASSGTRGAVPLDADATGAAAPTPPPWRSRAALRRAPRGTTCGVSTFIIVAFFAQLLPWIPVSRCTFAYHYFPSVPFLILALAWLFNRFDSAAAVIPRAKNGRRPSLWQRSSLGKRHALAFTLVALALLALFYPVLRGIEIPTAYHQFVTHWLPSWPI